MELSACLPHLAGLVVERTLVLDDALHSEVTIPSPQARCPACGQPSERVHSAYRRRVADLPLGGRRAVLRLRVRRFRCDEPTCPRRTFAELAPAVAARYARRSPPLRATLAEVGLTLGGRPGSRLARWLGMPAGRSTLLRLVRALPEPAVGAPRVLGIDEFALRRGRTYAVLLVDLEAHRPVDVLAEKSADAVAAWLAKHGGAVEVICRDRCAVFADGASRGAPDAVQVADRFHLLRGLAEAAAAVIARHPACLEAEDAAPTPTASAGATPPTEPEASPRPLSANQRARRAAVQELAARGLSISAIARALDLDRKTVRRSSRADVAATARPPARRRRTLLDAFLDELHRRWADGCRNARRLFAEIRERGYRGSYSTVRAYLAHLRDGQAPRRRRLATVREVARLILRRPEELDEAGRAVLERVVGQDAELTAACRRAQGFAALLRARRGDDLAAWVEAARASGIAELAAFAAGLRTDWAAVVAGLTLEWSSGQVEGQVNRVKLLKRQGYGRAKIDLLRKRILLAG